MPLDGSEESNGIVGGILQLIVLRDRSHVHEHACSRPLRAVGLVPTACKQDAG